MPLSSLSEAFLTKAVYAVAIAAVIGGGATVIDNKITNVRQDVQIEEIAQIRETLKDVTQDLGATARQLAVIADRLDRKTRENDR